MLLWDTETGKTVGDFSNGKMAYCVRFYPVDENIFLVGSANKRVVQYDARVGDVVQEYDYHLAAVNTVTFFDNGRRFVSSSDDKKVLVWEMNTPVPIHYISDPSMHSIPHFSSHPNGAAIVGQSLDNTIVTYDVAGGKFRQNRKKTFKDHLNAGYACQIDFSPDGQFMTSGDGDGKLSVWQWRNGRRIKTLNAHNKGPCIGVQWHPIHPSTLFTCGWDGLIKMWD